MTAQLEPSSAAAAIDRRDGGLRRLAVTFIRPIVAIVLAVIEIIVTSLLFAFDVHIPFWMHPAYWVRQVQMLAIVAAVAWAIMMWPRRVQLGEMWASTTRASGWRLPLAVNLGLFAVLCVLTVAFTEYAAKAETPPWALFGLYCIPLVATGLSLLWLFAPVAFWKRLFGEQLGEILLALAVGVFLLVLGGLAQTGWESLAGITLVMVYHLLALYESSVQVSFTGKWVAVRDYLVIIDQSCSGYEGMALVTAFMCLYLWTFRASLRFPNALLLVPLGLVAIFLLNSVRIAILTSIGAHVSPEIASGGFHSQAGWMAFLGVTLGFMAIAPRLSFFSLDAKRAPKVTEPADRLTEALLVPFMGLMAGSILAAASAPYDTWLYGLKIVLALSALIYFRAHYRAFVDAVSPLAVVVGIAIGVAWIATDPNIVPEKRGDLGTWLAAQSAMLAAAWLLIRAFGGIIIVPIVEELAFRGLLYRWLIARGFETVSFRHFSLVALVISSALFGLMHSRPIAGALAGAAFALLMLRSGRLSDAIASHIAANAVIILWAIAVGQWTLL